MSEITMKTIETLPLVEEPAEGASLVGWNDGRTVRMPVDAVGGSKGIVFTYEYDESAGDDVAPNSVEPMNVAGGAYVTKCNYNFDECYELLQAGAPVVFVDTDNGIVSATMQGSFGIDSASPESIAPFASTFSAPDGAYIYLSFNTWNGTFNMGYTADYLEGGYESGAEPV